MSDAPSSTALAAVHLRLDAIEAGLDRLAAIVAALTDPAKELAALRSRVAGLDLAAEGLSQRIAAEAAARSAGQAEAVTWRDLATKKFDAAALAPLRDELLEAAGTIIAEHRRAGQAAAAGLAQEVARAKAGSPAAQAADVLRHHLAAWSR
jgi:hypothetical protein